MRDEETPKHFKKATKHSKCFGIRLTYEAFRGKRCSYTRWYATEKARDQAFNDLPRHECYWFKRKGGSKYETVER